MKRKLVNVIKTVVVGLTLCTALTIGMSLKGENKAHATGYYNINVKKETSNPQINATQNPFRFSL